MDDVSEANQVQPSSIKALGFDFRGDGLEYFKVWIVNILLTIITLGIYSPWAHVRNNRYFYSNLFLDGHNFRYLAEPLKILKGRVIAVTVFIAYTLIVQANLIAGLVLTVLLIFVIPFFLNMSLAFERRMTAYKNIQFRFKASYGEAFMAIYIWPLLGMLTMGILYPLAMLKMHQYVVRNSAYGTTKFEFNATYGDYGKILLTMLGVGIMLGLPAWGITLYMPDLAIISPIIMAVAYFGLIVYFMVAMNKLVFSNLTLGNHGYELHISMAGLAQVILINVALTILTVGLYLPAAKVRMTKYFANNMVMHADGSLDNFAAAEKEKISALGQEFAEVFDFGV